MPLPEDGFYPLYKENVIISAPILLDEGKVLALVMLVKKNAYSYRADIEFVTGLANHFAMQIKLSEMETEGRAEKSGASDPAVPDQSALPVQFIKYDLLFLPGKAGEGEGTLTGTELLFPQHAGGYRLYGNAGHGVRACKSLYDA